MTARPPAKHDGRVLAVALSLAGVGSGRTLFELAPSESLRAGTRSCLSAGARRPECGAAVRVGT